MIWGTNFAPYVMSTILRAFAIMVPKIMKRKGLKAILQYIDDFLLLGDKESVNLALKVLRDLLESCGFVISEEKTSKEAVTEIDWLGFHLDGDTIKVDKKRIWKIQAGLQLLLGYFPYYKNLQKLLGLIQFCSAVVHGVKPLIRKLLAGVPSQIDNDIKKF